MDIELRMMIGQSKRGRPTKIQQEFIKSITESYYDSPMTYEQISKDSGFNRKTIAKYLNPLYKEAMRKADEAFSQELKKREKKNKWS